jgi:hypothetical protein
MERFILIDEPKAPQYKLVCSKIGEAVLEYLNLGIPASPNLHSCVCKCVHVIMKEMKLNSFM